MQYSDTRLCHGYSNEAKPCEHMGNCNLHIGFQWDENGNEHYIIGRGQNAIKCKRDNPDFKPLNMIQVLELYKKMPNKTMSLYDFMECARINGILEE